MDTQYINVAHTEHRERNIRAELRVESSEAYEGLLDVGVFGHSTGDQKVLLSLDREQVEQLRAALDVYLAEGS